MSGQLPSFLNGSNVKIQIGEVVVAFANNLTVQRNMANVPVASIGSYSVQAQEPTMFSASGSLSIQRYSSKMMNGAGFDRTSSQNKRVLPDQLKSAPAADASGLRDGNSVVDAISFNPRKLLISSTFDISVYERGVDPKTGEHNVENQKLLYVLQDCRLTSYSFNFQIGSLLDEAVTFVARNIIDGGGSSLNKELINFEPQKNF